MSPAEKMAKSPRPHPLLGSKGGVGRSHRSQVFDCNLRDKRVALGLSLRMVAEGTGLTHTMIRDAEFGYSITLEHAFCLAKFFGLSIDRIWTERVKS